MPFHFKGIFFVLWVVCRQNVAKLPSLTNKSSAGSSKNLLRWHETMAKRMKSRMCLLTTDRIICQAVEKCDVINCHVGRWCGLKKKSFFGARVRVCEGMNEGKLFIIAVVQLEV